MSITGSRTAQQPELVASCPASTPRQAVEVLVLGDDEQPVSDLGLVLESPSEGAQSELTDARGRCRFEGIPEEQTVRLTLAELDRAAWERVAALPLEPESARSPTRGSWSATRPSDRPAAPVRVEPGECLIRLAYAHGFLPETLWTHNQAIWRPHHRKGVLTPGMEIQLPQRAVGWIDVAAGHLVVLHRIGIPVVMTIRVVDAHDRAWADSPYVLSLRARGGRPVPHQVGVTDRDGRLHAPVLPDVTHGRLDIEPRRGGRRWSFALSVSSLRPADEPEGAAARLWNLGFRRATNPLWREGEVLASFQDEEPSVEPGPLDAATATALVERHGS